MLIYGALADPPGLKTLPVTDGVPRVNEYVPEAGERVAKDAISVTLCTVPDSTLMM